MFGLNRSHRDRVQTGIIHMPHKITSLRVEKIKNRPAVIAERLKNDMVFLFPEPILAEPAGVTMLHASRKRCFTDLRALDPYPI